MTTQSTTPNATFYSAAAGLIVNINIGHRVIDPGGTTSVVGQKVAEFTPIGDGFGKLVTNDPEIIEKMSARMATVGDVFDAAEYNRRTIPADVRLKDIEKEHARLLEDHNRLLAQRGPSTAGPSTTATVARRGCRVRVCSLGRCLDRRKSHPTSSRTTPAVPSPAFHPASGRVLHSS